MLMLLQHRVQVMGGTISSIFKDSPKATHANLSDLTSVLEVPTAPTTTTATTTKAMTLLDVLPDELTLQVLVFFDQTELRRLATVSKKLCSLSGDPLLWRSLCRKTFDLMDEGVALWKRELLIAERCVELPTVFDPIRDEIRKDNGHWIEMDDMKQDHDNGNDNDGHACSFYAAKQELKTRRKIRAKRRALQEKERVKRTQLSCVDWKKVYRTLNVIRWDEKRKEQGVILSGANTVVTNPNITYLTVQAKPIIKEGVHVFSFLVDSMEVAWV